MASSTVFYNGAGGKPLADFYYDTANQAVRGGTPMVYFAGKRVDNQSVEDRLGTAVVEGGTTRRAFYPYGELRGDPATDVQFATYKRDSVTNLDYAHHRYFSSQIARFTTPDPSGSASAEDPRTFNQYGYVGGDPVNDNDPTGLWWDGVDPGVGHPLAVRESGGLGGDPWSWTGAICGPIHDIGLFGDAPSRMSDIFCFAQLPFQYVKRMYLGGGGSGDKGPSPQTKQAQAALANLRKAIDPDCLSWLESGIAGGNVNIFNQFYALLMQTIGTADFSGTKYQNQNAVTGAPEYTSPITINTDGAFFSSDKGVGYGSSKIISMQPNSGTARFEILLHELAHYFQVPGFIQLDDTNGKQAQNNNLVLEHCSKTLFPGAL